MKITSSDLRLAIESLYQKLYQRTNYQNNGLKLSDYKVPWIEGHVEIEQEGLRLLILFQTIGITIRDEYISLEGGKLFISDMVRRKPTVENRNVNIILKGKLDEYSIDLDEDWIHRINETFRSEGVLERLLASLIQGLEKNAKVYCKLSNKSDNLPEIPR